MFVGLTPAHRLLAAPLQRVQTHSGPWTNQLIAGFAQEVDLVSDAEHPAQSAAVSGGLGFGAGCCGADRQFIDLLS